MVARQDLAGRATRSTPLRRSPAGNDKAADTSRESNHQETASALGSGGGLDRLMEPDVSITQELRLPNFTRAANESVLAYPPPVPNLALQVLSAMPPDTFDWRNWHEEFEKRGRCALVNRRQIAEAEVQLRAQHEAAEVRKAKEADQVAVGR
jgi:hypothetical protein